MTPRWHGAVLLLALSIPLIVRSWLVWPWFQLGPLLIYFVVVCLARQSVTWAQTGQFNTRLAFLHLTVAGAVLLSWNAVVRADLSDVRAMIPATHVAAAWLVFSVLNAAMEEVIWRGVLFDALRSQLGDRLALAVQGIAFGILHAHGVPRGRMGEILASCFGLSQGWLRLRTGGLLVPLVVHIGVDAVIFGLVWTS